ncbi:MAG: helicase-related protein, partial [Patescibacteria group bacterium]
APTEILARQHFAEFIKLFSPFGIKLGLITSAECLKYPSKAFQGKPTHISRSQLLKWVGGGEISILLGTHSLIQEAVKFKNLALIVIDEQHRFGINQRLKLSQKNTERIPHLLSMTATPIPRTLALTIYGDLDLTVIDELPPGRKRVITEMVSPAHRQRAYEHVREQIQAGRQAYVLCPRIEGADDNPESLLKLTMKAVKEEYKKLSEEVFPEFCVGMLHGKMAPKEKEKVLKEFRENKIKILVATSVIEVGINIPNTTVILIEGAERFGLAQLHQLRGRVMRSEHQPYCFLFTESSSEKTKARLSALVEAKNGFELAERDLELRGAGELTGDKQWGISDVGMEALKNIKMVEAAREEARDLIESGELEKHPALFSLALKNSETLHFE